MRAHLFKFIRASDEFGGCSGGEERNGKRYQTAIGMRLFSWCDCVLAIVEIRTLSTGVTGLSFIAAVTGAAVVAQHSDQCPRYHSEWHQEQGPVRKGRAISSGGASNVALLARRWLRRHPH